MNPPSNIRCDRLDQPVSITDAIDEAVLEARRIGLGRPVVVRLGMWKWYQFKDAMATAFENMPCYPCNSNETRYCGLLIERMDVPGIVVECAGKDAP